MRKIFFGFILLFSLLNVLAQPISFAPYKLLPWREAEPVLIGDINNDNLNDIIVGVGVHGIYDSSVHHKILVYLQNKNGGLDSAVVYSYYDTSSGNVNEITSMAFADVNNDGRTDLVYSFDDSIGIFFQDSLGSLTRSIGYRVVQSGRAVALDAGDLNNDGLDDIAISYTNLQANGNFISVYYNNGNGYTIVNYPVSFNAFFSQDKIEIIDANNDGLNDVVMNSSQEVVLFTQNVNGTLDSAFYFSSLFGNRAGNDVSIGDIDGDGKNEIALTRSINDSLILLFQDSATRQFTRKLFFSIPESFTSLAINDIDCDEIDDILIAYMVLDKLIIYQNVTTNISSDSLPTIYIQHNGPYSLAIGDINNDGKKDIVLSEEQYGVMLFINQTDFGNRLVVDSIFSCDTTSILYDVTIIDTFYTEYSDTLNNNTIVSTKKTFLIDYAYKISDTNCKRIINKVGCGITTVPDTTIMIISDTISGNIDSTLLSVVEDSFSYNGIRDSNMLSTIQLFPNPTKDVLFIRTASPSNQAIHYRIINTLGETIISSQAITSEYNVDVSILSAGIYFLLLIDNNNTDVKRFIKK